MYKVNINWNICRICLSEDEQTGILRSIFQTDKDSVEISSKISQCGGINIKRGLNLPESICEKCLAYLNISYKFRKVCQDSAEKLNEFLKNSNIEEEKDTDIINKFDDIIEEVTDVTELVKSEEEDYIITELETEEEQGIYEEESVIEESNILTEPEIIQDTAEPRVNRKIITIFPEDIQPKQKKLHICDVCGNRYSKKSALETHIKWHTQEKTSICEICNKGFVTDFQLSRHMRTHTGEKPYSCQFCLRKFADISTRTKHERIHTNERPYKCDVCPKAFNYSDVLRTHKLTHSGEKPFSCDVCCKRFTQYHHLKAHLKTLTHEANLSK